MLNEFAWQREEDGSYKNGEALDCQIGITEDGKFEIRNHSDHSESQKFETPEELGEALASVLKERASR